MSSFRSTHKPFSITKPPNTQKITFSSIQVLHNLSLQFNTKIKWARNSSAEGYEKATKESLEKYALLDKNK